MEIKNIIVSRTDKIGDLVLSIPSFFMVKKMYPSAKLTVLVRNYNYDVVKSLSYIDEVINSFPMESPEPFFYFHPFHWNIYICYELNEFL